MASKSQIKKNTGYFILLPNYAYKDISKLKKYDKFDKYNVIRYSQLLDFFKTCTTNLMTVSRIFFPTILAVILFPMNGLLNIHSLLMALILNVVSSDIFERFFPKRQCKWVMSFRFILFHTFLILSYSFILFNYFHTLSYFFQLDCVLLKKRYFF